MFHVALIDSQQQLRCSDHFDTLQEANKSYLQARKLQDQVDESSLVILEKGAERVKWHFHENQTKKAPPPGQEISPTQPRKQVSRVDAGSLKDKLVDLTLRLLAIK